MNLLYAIFMGIVQGLTEFLPVSSSGHLALLSSIIELGEDTLTFSVMLHAGTLGAVFVAYRKDIADILRDCMGFGRELCSRRTGGQKPELRPGVRLMLLLIVSLLPMFVALPLKSGVESLFSSTPAVGCLLFVTAALLLIIDLLARRAGQVKDTQTATWKDALVVGLFQIIALLPGVSRSGSTIAGGLFRRFDREFAVKFSFLMSIPTIAGALLLDVIDILRFGIDPSLLLYGLAGMIASGIVGYFAIGLVRHISKSGRFYPFAIWCALVGTATVILSLL